MCLSTKIRTRFVCITAVPCYGRLRAFESLMSCRALQAVSLRYKSTSAVASQVSKGVDKVEELNSSSTNIDEKKKSNRKTSKTTQDYVKSIPKNEATSAFSKTKKQLMERNRKLSQVEDLTSPVIASLSAEYKVSPVHVSKSGKPTMLRDVCPAIAAEIDFERSVEDETLKIIIEVPKFLPPVKKNDKTKVTSSSEGASSSPQDAPSASQEKAEKNLTEEIRAMRLKVLQDIPFDSPKVIHWKCSICSCKWTAAVSRRTLICAGNCPDCHRRMHPLLIEIRPDLLGEFNCTKNDVLLLPERLEATDSRRIAWECSKCNKNFEARVRDRVGVAVAHLCKVIPMRGMCPHCCSTRLKINRVDAEILAEEFHPTRNGDLTIANLREGDKKKVWWLCRVCGNEWCCPVAMRCLSAGHSRQHMCPECFERQKKVESRGRFAIGRPKTYDAWSELKKLRE